MKIVCALLLGSALYASDAIKIGDDRFQASDWAGAVESYSAAAKEDPNSGAAWFKLGMTYRKMAKNTDAIAAFQKAIANQYQAPGAMVRIAGALGADGKDKEALSWLRKAADAGFSMPGSLWTDPVLTKLAKTPEGQTAVKTMTDNLRVCDKKPEYRQFDFWEGDWTVTIQGQFVGTNHVEKILNGCALMENWVGAGGIAGKSFNVYDAASGKWQQRWMDETGRVTDYVGEFRDGAMRFEAQPNLRMTFTPLEGGRVRQLIEQSADSGKSWTSMFDGIYAKTK